MLHHATVPRSFALFLLALAVAVPALAQDPLVPRLPPSSLLLPPVVPSGQPEPEIAGPPYVPDPVPDEVEAEPDPLPAAPLDVPLALSPAALPTASGEPGFVGPSPDVVGAEDSVSLARRAAALLRGLDVVPAAGMVPGAVAPDGFVPQYLARAVFSAPVAGSIPYVLHAEVYHDLTIIFPVTWRVVDVHVGDPDRWAVTRVGHLIMLKPGEVGIRTNLTALFDNGDLLQMDLQEVTGLQEPGRTGRAYVGPERWLVDRIFGMLPPIVRTRVARSPATVAELLADPVTVVGLYGGTGAVPNPLAAIAALENRAGGDPSVVSVPTLASLDGVEPAAEGAPLVPPAPPTVPALREPAVEEAEDGGLPGSGLWVPGGTVRELEADLRAAVNRVESARVSAGDRVASAQRNVELEMEELRSGYPLRTQFSYLLDPPVDPYVEPFWHFGIWHDGDRTFVRLMADDPQFVDEDTGEVLPAIQLRNYLYRFDRLIENGSVIVAEPDSGDRRALYFRRRRELEGP